MALEDPVVITCAISGVLANREQCPAIPYTPEEYGAEARRAVEEGASMIHIHARTPDGAPSFEIEDYRAIAEAIRLATGTPTVPVEKLMIAASPTSARIASRMARKSSTSYDGAPSGVRAWIWMCTPPSSTIRRASAPYSSGV